MNIPEILAPAGSYEAYLAAVHNGCDAVYIGGKDYGARAYASNFDLETMGRAVVYGHKYGVKTYLTINTLFKEKEVDGLLDYVEQVLNQGIDALIVQDLGIVRLLRQVFPEAELHASTQMNCHSSEGVHFLETMGISRVVLARELSIDEIKDIQANSSMELEAFVHGALCYCYSGQCLMSSFYGGRSGNRGRCAQPCRLQYKAALEEGISDKSHILSPKDIETLTILPELIEAGIHSLKIEGRMKSPEYVGLITGLYRHYRDKYIKEGTYKVTQDDLDRMIQIFNRGGFSQGYYHQHSGPEMITFDQPKNQGKSVGKIVAQKGNRITLQLKESLLAGDCIELALTGGKFHSLILQKGLSGRTEIFLHETVKLNSLVRRIKSVRLNEAIQEKNSQKPTKSIRIEAVLAINKAAQLKIIHKASTFTVVGDQVTQAQKQAITKERVEKQLRKVGDYPVQIEGMSIELDEGAFIAVSQLNALRRKALDELLEVEPQKVIVRKVIPKEKVKNTKSNEKNIIVLLNYWHQIETVLTYDVKRIYVEWLNFSEEQMASLWLEPKIVSGETEVYLAMPKILRQEKRSVIRKLMDNVPDQAKGFLVRSMEGYELVAHYNKKLVWDYSMNVMNQATAELLMGKEGSEGFMPSLELKAGELKGLDLKQSEALVFGHVTVMTSAQCVRKTTDGCQFDQGHLFNLVDRKEVEMPVVTHCRLCYNTIYNGLPLNLIDKIDVFKSMGIGNFRVEFLNEEEALMKRVLDGVFAKEQVSADRILPNYTRGHFNKGVE